MVIVKQIESGRVTSEGILAQESVAQLKAAIAPNDPGSVELKSSLPDSQSCQNVARRLRSSYSDPGKKVILMELLTNRDGLESLCETVPGLRDDAVALGVLRDQSLLARWLSPKFIKQSVEAHPVLLKACEQLLADLQRELVKRGSSGGLQTAMLAGSNPFYADSDEDEEGAGPSNAQMAAGAPSVITPELLQHALSAAGASPQVSRSTPIPAASSSIPVPGSSGSGSTPSVPPNSILSGGGGPDGGLITPEMLQMAMQSFLGSGVAPEGSPAQAATPGGGAASNNANGYDHLLPQLHELGFVDDAENRAALAATNGDSDAAIEWIIDRREQNDQLD